MATITAYALSSNEGANYQIAVAGAVKRRIKSKLDEEWGETSSPFSPKLYKGKEEDQLKVRFATCIAGLEHMTKIGATAADRTFLWLVDSEVVELLNKNSPMTLIDTLKTRNMDHETATEIATRIYTLKTELGCRIGFQQTKDKRNRYIDTANQMLANQSAPKIPEWETALAKARRKQEIAVMQQQLQELESMQDDEHPQKDQ